MTPPDLADPDRPDLVPSKHTDAEPGGAEGCEAVHFVAGPLAVTQFEPHAGLGGGLQLPLSKVVAEFERVRGQLTAVVQALAEASPAAGMDLSEVEVSLAFDTRGQLAFIAEAGVAAGVKVTFTRG